MAWSANEHTLLVMHTRPRVCRSPGITKLAEWGMGCVCLMSAFPTFSPTVPESHSEFIRVGFGMGSAWVGHSQVRMSYTGLQYRLFLYQSYRIADNVLMFL